VFFVTKEGLVAVLGRFGARKVAEKRENSQACLLYGYGRALATY
jgi:hypothetical protein